MTVITVRERSARDDGSFTVEVHVGDAEHTAVVANPFDTAQERELIWYFEEHLRFPFLDWDRRDAAARAVAEYGQALFEQLFPNEGARNSYRRLRESGFDGCRIEVVGSAGLHQLHWEALRDPEFGTPLAVRLPLTRRVAGQGTRFDLPAERAAVNILVVTARPDGPKDVGYRTVSRPLLESLRLAEVPVTVEFVRPGTWAALRQALQTKTDVFGTGWFQVVHFDVHGLFGGHATLEEGRRGGRLTFDPADVPAFEGQQGMLFFETASDGVAQPVPAGQVASLLAEHRVPVAVLNACQSATQSVTEAGLAQQLAQAGVPLTMGMAYSVTVSAAAAAMPVLYGRFAAGSRPVEAAHAARRVLFEQRGRRGYFDQVIDLEDWVLPVVFSQRSLDLRLRPRTPAEEVEFFEREAAVAPEPMPRYGFVGRDLDVQAIERRLLLTSDGNELLVRGMAGAGKSTLLEHLGWWWQRTGLVERVFAFSYEDRAWTADQIVRELAKQLFTPVEQAVFDSLSEPARLERIAGLLRARRYLLVLDNAESITAGPAAIPHALDETHRARLAELLRRLRGGRSLVLIGSRQDESWLSPGTFAANIYDLTGLDPQAASQLVERILHEHGGSHYRSDPDHRDALRELVDLLGGFPLPMTVVLPALAGSTPAAILAQLRQGDIAADPVGIIRRAIEYSHGNLDPAVQQSMLLLAPFTATIPTGPILAAYQEELQTSDPVQALGDIDLAAAVDEIIRVGLAAPHRHLPLVEVVPVLPYFLRTRLHDQPAHVEAARDAHYHLCVALAWTIHTLLTGRDPQQRAAGQAFARAIYANLTAATDHGTGTGKPITRLINAVAVYLQQHNQHPALAILLEEVLSRHQPDGHDFSVLERAFLHGFAGRTALELRQLDEAGRHYQAELSLRESSGERRGQGIIHHQLGMVAQEQRRFGEAERHYQQALDIKLEFNDRHSAASTYHQLGTVAEEQRRFEEAERHYQQALDIKLEFNDRHGAAGTYHQLGRAAEVQQRFEEAERHYQQALDIKLEFNDRHSAAGTYHQLGVVAQEQQRFGEAERHYRQALDIVLEFNDRDGAARTYHQLGMVAQEQQRFGEAERHYQQALDIVPEFNDRHGRARTYHQLGTVAQEQQRFGEAERHYQQALDIFLEFNDRHGRARTYHQLGTVAQEQQRFGEAERHYRQALDIVPEFNDRHGRARTYHQLGVVLEQQDHHDEALAALLRAATLWHESTRSWPGETLAHIDDQREHTNDQDFINTVNAIVPARLIDRFFVALGQARDT